MDGHPIKTRVLKKDDRFYPQYWSEGLFGLFKGYKYYKEEILCLNGIYTDIVKGDLYFRKIEDAENWIEQLQKQTKIVWESH